MISTSIPSDYFAFQKALFKVFGVCFDGQENMAYKIYSFVILTLSPFSYMFLGFAEVFMEHPFEELCLMLVYDFCMALGAAKVVVVLLNRRKLKETFIRIAKGVFAPNFERGGKLEYELILDCIKFNIRLRRFYSTVLIMSLTGTIANTLIKRLSSNNFHDWELGFCSFTIVNVTYSPNFEIMMIYQDIAVVCGAMQFISFDLIFVGVLSNLCVQFKILQNSLKRIVENSYHKMLKDFGTRNAPNMSDNFDPAIVSIKYLREAVKEVVFHHLAIIDLAKDIEEVYSTVLLVIYLTSMILLCLGFYLCSVVTVTDSKVLIFTSGMLTLWCQIFCICYWCDDVTKQSMAVGKAAYDVTFVGAHPSFQRDLTLIMKGSLNPTIITAGKFFSITLDTFMKIQKAAYSIFMVINKRSSKIKF